MCGLDIGRLGTNIIDSKIKSAGYVACGQYILTSSVLLGPLIYGCVYMCCSVICDGKH